MGNMSRDRGMDVANRGYIHVNNTSMLLGYLAA